MNTKERAAAGGGLYGASPRGSCGSLRPWGGRSKRLKRTIGIARWLRYSDVLRASVFLTAVGLLETANGQSQVVSLREAMTRGAIAIESVAGTGGSSGTVLHGDLVNHNSAYYSIDVRLDTPLYFRNRSAGQNMVAVQLYGRDGSYMSDGTRGFVRVGPRARLPITFVAYCADFDKENQRSRTSSQSRGCRPRYP